MCGIAGWIAAPGRAVDRESLRAMAAAIAHRGPDDAGEYFSADGGVGVAHRRLSIIDLSAASHQPMVDSDRGLVLVYNGELYNFRELKAELEGLGHSFSTSGDTEVVLEAFAAWGEGCFARFAGMFALAIWNERESRLWLARDATGMKPLYFSESAGELRFASEIKAFLEIPGFRAEVEPESLGQFLEFGYVFDGDATMLRGVRKVLPGEVVEIGRSGIRRRFRHFEPPAADSLSEAEGAERVAALHETLSRVVSQHLIADVPVGLLLSGGIDSSLIAAYAARDCKLTTVTMAFADSPIDERAPARRVAEFLGTDHHEVELRPEEIAAEVVDDAWIFDDLFADWGTVSTRILYRKFRGLGFKVALVGEGSDELFGGYPIFDAAAAERSRGPLGQFRLYRRYAGQRYGRQFGRFRRLMREYLSVTGGSLFESVRRFEVERQLPNNYVMKVDKAAMSVSLEARAPFLDRRIAELAYRTPREWLLRAGENKWLLREVARRYELLPPEIAARPKFGASIAASWIEQAPAFRDLAREVVLDPSGWAGELGLRPAMERFFAGRSGDRFPRRYSVFNHLAWRLLLLNLWSERYLSRPLSNRSAVAVEAFRKATGSAAPPTAVRERVPGLVSTIIPVHNRPKLLVEAVESVLAQSYREIEILIVDDGSTDETPEIAGDLAQAHPGLIRVLRRAQGGPGLAREAGRREARGEFVQYLDSDDLLLPRKLELQVDVLRRTPDAVAAYGISEELNSDGSIGLERDQPSNRKIERMFPAFLRQRFWNTGAALYRAAVVDEVGPWRNLWQEEDWEHDCRVAALGRPIAFVDAPAVRIRRGDQERLSRGTGLRPDRLRDRARAHESILRQAQRAGVAATSPEMQHFAKELFLLARQCGAKGLVRESRTLLNLAAEVCPPSRVARFELAVYRGAAHVLGWKTAGGLAAAADQLRARSADG